MADRHREILAKVADLSLALACNLQARAIAAADDQAACDLSLAFHRITRSLRQTLALEARLERERARGEREAARDLARETLARVQRRRRQVRAAIAPLIWTEGEDEESENLLEELESRLFEASEDEDFLEAPLEACIARIRADLGLPADNDAEGTARAAAAPAQAPEIVIWRSSA